MSVLQKRMADQRASGSDARGGNPVIGKLSIGVPSDEPAIVDERIIDLKVAKDITFTRKTRTQEATGIVRGSKITARHVEQMKEAGIKEVPVVYGSFPERLDHFRLTRQATHHGGYLHDLAQYERYGLEVGFTECPIILTSEDIGQVVRSRLVNYDRANKCVFCTSNDGETARRLQADPENGGYQEGFYEVECIPFHDDPRKQQGKAVCEFRKHGASLPCKFAGSLSFQLIPEDPAVGIPLGQYFKMDSTSAEAGANWMRALEDVKRHFGRISFVPLKLQTVKVNTVYYDGAQKKDTQVVRTTIAVDPEYLAKYKPHVEKMIDLVKSYGGILMPEEVMNDDEVAAWTAEFNPRERQKDLLEQGLVTEEEIEAEARERGESQGRFSGGGSSRISRPAKSSPAVFERRKAALMITARRMPPDRYQDFLSKEDKLTPQNIGKLEAFVTFLLGEVPEQEQAAHFDANTATPEPASEETSSDPDDGPMILTFDSDEDPAGVDPIASDEA